MTAKVAKSIHEALLAVGSNMGDRLAYLQAALDALSSAPGIDVRRVSRVYETVPFGGPPESSDFLDLSAQPLFLNAVARIETDLSPQLLLVQVQAVETALDRVRTSRWSARTIDVDIIVYDGIEQNDPLLTLPHPRAHEREFVLRPWLDIEPDAVMPGRGPVEQLLKELAASDVVARPDHLLNWHNASK